MLRARLREKLVRELGEQRSGGGRKRKRGNDDDDYDDVNADDEAEVKLEDDSYDALNDSRENAIDAKFFGANGSVLPSRSRRYHTTESLLEAMQNSIDTLGKEIEDLDGRSEAVLGEMQETVGALSDLRYGKFARVSGVGGEETIVEEEVVDALKELTNAALRKTKDASKGGSIA